MSTSRFLALVAATAGVEVQMLLPNILRGEVHVAQLWRFVRCWCGEEHQVADAMSLTIIVGADPPRSPPASKLAVAIVPARGEDLEVEYPRIVVTEPRDFGPRAAALVRHLAESLLRAGLVGLDFQNSTSPSTTATLPSPSDRWPSRPCKGAMVIILLAQSAIR